MSEPLGVAISGIDASTTAPPTASTPAAATTPTTVASGTASGAGLGTLSVTATAPDLAVTAAWLDALAANGHLAMHG